MHYRIATTLLHLEQDLAERLDERAVHDASGQAGHAWRPCMLTPVAILHDRKKRCQVRLALG